MGPESGATVSLPQLKQRVPPAKRGRRTKTPRQQQFRLASIAVPERILEQLRQLALTAAPGNILELQRQLASTAAPGPILELQRQLALPAARGNLATPLQPRRNLRAPPARRGR